MSENFSLTFLQKYNNINGTTIGQRRKEFFELLRKYDHLRNDEVTLQTLRDSMKSETYLQQKFMVEFYIFFRRYSDLLVLLKSEKEYLMKRLWKQKWFFEILFEIENGDYIVNELFSHLSYVIRIRFLNNVVMHISDESKLDDLYDKVLCKYGVSNADILLPGCSLVKIQSIISERKICFSNRGILFLLQFKKHYLVELISLKESKSIFDFYDKNSRALSVIGGFDFELFFKIINNQSYSRLGKRLTRKIMLRKKNNILSDTSLKRNLKHKIFLKELKADFRKFFYSQFPTSFKDFCVDDCLRLLKFYPKNCYVKIIEDGIQEVYKKSLKDYSAFTDLLKYIDDAQTRETLLEKAPKFLNEEPTAPQYLGIEKSILLLKKRLDLTDDVTSRKVLLNAVVYTCKLNNNTEALLEVLKYFSIRHRNDDEYIKYSFLEKIMKHFEMPYLTLEHWNYILEVLEYSKSKQKPIRNHEEINIQYIKFLYINHEQFYKRYNQNIPANIDFKIVVLSYLDNIMDSLNTFQDIPELEKYLLLKLMELIPTKVETEEKRTQMGYKLFLAIFDWNKRQLKDKSNNLIMMSNNSFIKSSILSKFENASYKDKIILTEILTKKISFEPELFIEVEGVFWENLDKTFSVAVIEHYLRRDPSYILKHFDEFVCAAGKQYSYETLIMWRLVKHYDHLDLPLKIVENYKESSTYFGSGKCVALATLMNCSEYLNMLSIPEGERIIENEEVMREKVMSRDLFPYLKYFSDSSLLPPIVEFCKGDYLHDALVPLYFYFFHTAEKHLLSHLQKLSTRAVSVRKHSVKLACSVSPKAVIYSLISQMTESEKNQSALIHLFRKSFSYFKRNPSEELWVIVQKQLSLLNLIDSPILNEICSLSGFADKFKFSYLSLLWDLLDSAEKNGKDVSKFKVQLVRELTPELFRELPVKFCDKFIKENLLKSISSYIITEFIVNCLIHSNHKDGILKTMFDVIQNFKTTSLNISSPDFTVALENRQKLDRFVYTFYQELSLNSKVDSSIISSFFLSWCEIFTQEENVTIFLLLTLLNELRSYEHLDDLTFKVDRLFNKFIDEEYGMVGIMDCFKSVLVAIFSKEKTCSDIDASLFKFALNLVEKTTNVKSTQLAIKLLPDVSFEDNIEYKRMFSQLKGILEKSTDKHVLSCFDFYLSTVRNNYL